jgi:hypothetical protein
MHRSEAGLQPGRLGGVHLARGAGLRRQKDTVHERAGGLEALGTLLPALPADLPAAVFVVMHLGATSHLGHILGRTSALPVARAESGMKIERSKIYVAVPNAHLLLHDDHILLRRGPRENQARPAIEPTFRSAAISFGGRTIGVILSGSLPGLCREVNDELARRRRAPAARRCRRQRPAHDAPLGIKIVAQVQQRMAVFRDRLAQGARTRAPAFSCPAKASPTARPG